MTIKYLFDLGKIVEGSANGDHEKVVAYVQRLIERLDEDGDVEGARRLRQILGKSRAAKMVHLAEAPLEFQSLHPVPVDGESRLPVADETRLTPTDVQVFLPAEAERTITQFLSFFRAADRLVANGVGISASLLLYGPPGCGKTHVAKFIAAQLGLPLITARTDTLISSYLGSTAKNIRQLFTHAMSRPCVLFLDEFDAVAKMRDDSHELGELKRVVISLLQNIDAMGEDHVLLAATNHEHLLDPAIWRRFTYKLRLAEPDIDLRRQMLCNFFGAFASEDVVDLIAALSEGMSGAQLRTIAETCIRTAVLLNHLKIPQLEAIRAFLAAKPETQSVAHGSLSMQLRTIRSLSPKKFTQPWLARVFGISQSKVSRLLREEQQS